MKRISKKLRRIILLQFGLVTFRSHCRKIHKPITSMVFGLGGHAHGPKNQLSLVSAQDFSRAKRTQKALAKRKMTRLRPAMMGPRRLPPQYRHQANLVPLLQQSHPRLHRLGMVHLQLVPLHRRRETTTRRRTVCVPPLHATTLSL